MPTGDLEDILLICLEIERAASGYYHTIYEQTDSHEQKAFWEDVSKDEDRHFDYWDRLLLMERDGLLHSVFDDPEMIKDELKAMSQELRRILEGKTCKNDASSAILTALKLESHMLHPAFIALFRALSRETDDPSPEEDYWEHVGKLSAFVKKFLPQNAELNLVAEILPRMWKNNTEMVDHLDQVRTLRRLLPICANCKKIRDDKGYWNQIETYLEQHAYAKFTHGICPECVENLYPGLLDKDRIK